MRTSTEETDGFPELSAQLTGFDDAYLRATGLVEVYRAVAVEQLGTDLFERLLGGQGRPTEELNDDLLDAARAVTFLWYTGSWPGPPPFVVSPGSYAQGLAWRAAGLAAPATAPAGHGSWADRPTGSEVR
ncbi:hypothetical protein Sgleb_73220 [Streptomyces glebosus]|uniref:Uncharacterized protein n=1 Tax=Streptomyces glebosus TaxID=249580 RepID=A0A640TC80_9ACTN|nr:hypothetical protein [Streptomyces glebosus]GFE19275.1 hypothetical protein Sgleb_73220 [Streptomyces glebosus]GHG79074.1 hypothetical protein GCM10010513_56110 [Streptomyces glebosus]